MARLKFDATAVKALLDHATQAKEHNPVFADLCFPDAERFIRDDAKDSADVAAGRAIGYLGTQDAIDKAKIPAALWLVKDAGIYLMSNGNPPLLAELSTGEPGNRAQRVVYAEGYNPDNGDVWEACRAAVGGDDFAEALPISMFAAWYPDHGQHPTHIIVNVSARKISVTATYARPKPGVS